MTDKTFSVWKKEIDQYIINLTGSKIEKELNNLNLKKYYDFGIESNIMAFLIVSKNKKNYKLYDNFEIWNYDYNRYVNHLNHYDSKIIKTDEKKNRFFYEKYKDPLEKCLEELNKNLLNF